MADRDSKGRLLPGHKPFVVERSPGKNLGGRPKEFKTQVKDALKLAEDAMPDIIAKMIDRATGKDLDCDVKTRQAASEYLIDRIYGKANQPLSSSSPWEILITYGKPAEDKDQSPDP